MMEPMNPDLVESVTQGDDAEVRRFLQQDPSLLRRPADPQAADSLLHIAARAGQASTVSLLLDLGAPIHARNKCGFTAIELASNDDTRAALDELRRAVINLDVETVSRLVAEGADINKATNAAGQTLLHKAARQGEVRTVELLLCFGADVDRIDSSEMTPLHWAARLGHVSTLALLLASGSDAHMRDINGKTAEEVATPECMSILSEWMNSHRRLRIDHFGRLPDIAEECNHKKNCKILSLNVSRNDLSSLPQNYLLAPILSQLIMLDLSHNMLTVLPEELASLAKLETLNLAHNRLKVIPPEFFSGLTHLRTLDLSYNALQSFPNTCEKLVDLRHLDLSYNTRLNSLPHEVGKLSKLESLVLTACECWLLIPSEIRAGGPNAILLHYRDMWASEPVAVYRTKVMLVGYAAVGKTSLVDALVARDGWIQIRQRKRAFLARRETITYTNMWCSVRGRQLLCYATPPASARAASASTASSTERTRTLSMASNKTSTPTRPQSFSSPTVQSSLPLAPSMSALSALNAVAAGTTSTSTANPPTSKYNLQECAVSVLVAPSTANSRENPELGLSTALIPPPPKATFGLHLSTKTDGDIELYFPTEDERDYWAMLLRRQTMTDETFGIEVNRWIWNRIPHTEAEASVGAGEPLPNNRPMELSMWDFAGQDDYYISHPFFLSHRCVYLVIYDLTGRDGMIARRSSSDISESQSSSRSSKVFGFDADGGGGVATGHSGLEYWLRSIKMHVQVGHQDTSAVVIVVGTHADRVDNHPNAVRARREIVLNLAQRQGLTLQLSYTEVCALNRGPEDGVDALRLAVLEAVRHQPHMGELVPTSYLYVEDTIMALRRELENDGNVPMLPVSELQRALQSRHGLSLPTPEIRRALVLLAHWGVCVYFEKDGFEDLVIIDPQWLTVDVMASLNRSSRSRVDTIRNTVINPIIKDGILRYTQLTRVWHYPKSVCRRLAQLLEIFELGFTLQSSVDRPKRRSSRRLSTMSFEESQSSEYVDLEDENEGNACISTNQDEPDDEHLTLLLPHLLPEEPPVSLRWNQDCSTPQEAALVRIFDFGDDDLPEELFPRIVVRLHNHIDTTNMLVWRLGVLLNNNDDVPAAEADDRVLVTADPYHRKLRIEGRGANGLPPVSLMRIVVTTVCTLLQTTCPGANYKHMMLCPRCTRVGESTPCRAFNVGDFMVAYNPAPTGKADVGHHGSIASSAAATRTTTDGHGSSGRTMSSSSAPQLGGPSARKLPLWRCSKDRISIKPREVLLTSTRDEDNDSTARQRTSRGRPTAVVGNFRRSSSLDTPVNPAATVPDNSVGTTTQGRQRNTDSSSVESFVIDLPSMPTVVPISATGFMGVANDPKKVSASGSRLSRVSRRPLSSVRERALSDGGDTVANMHEIAAAVQVSDHIDDLLLPSENGFSRTDSDGGPVHYENAEDEHPYEEFDESVAVMSSSAVTENEDDDDACKRTLSSTVGANQTGGEAEDDLDEETKQLSGEGVSVADLSLCRQYNRSWLTRMKDLGHGCFGIVYLAASTEGGVKPRHLLAVKTLKLDNAETSHETTALQQSFVQEAFIMCHFQHENVLKLVGVCTEERPWLLIVEHAAYGDLANFLKGVSKCPSVVPTTSELLYLCCQVAAGMEHLVSRNYVHRDLAARNCLVATGTIVKVADFGLTRAKSENGIYAAITTKSRLPVRWMAPECLKSRKFTTANDIWSFGVVMWEVFTLGVQRPYATLPPHQVFALLRSGQRLSRPDLCPQDIYESLMMQCWHKDARKRPAFQQLSVRLTETQRNLRQPEVRDLGRALTIAYSRNSAAQSAVPQNSNSASSA